MSKICNNKLTLAGEITCQVFDVDNEVELDLVDPRQTLEEVYREWLETVIEMKDFPHEEGFFELFLAFGTFDLC